MLLPLILCIAKPNIMFLAASKDTEQTGHLPSETKQNVSSRASKDTEQTGHLPSKTKQNVSSGQQRF